MFRAAARRKDVSPFRRRVTLARAKVTKARWGCPRGGQRLRGAASRSPVMDTPRPPFYGRFRTLIFEIRFCLKQIVYLADPLYFWTRALRPTWSKSGLVSTENVERQCFCPTRAEPGARGKVSPRGVFHIPNTNVIQAPKSANPP